MVAPRPGTRWVPIRAYDTGEFVSNLRQHHVTPHVAQNLTNRRSAIDARTTRHPGVEREELELG